MSVLKMLNIELNFNIHIFIIQTNINDYVIDLKK